VRLRYQKRALQQIDKALGYIAARSPDGAAKVEARLTAVLALVQLQSFVGGKTSVPRVRRVFLISVSDRLLRGRWGRRPVAIRGALYYVRRMIRSVKGAATRQFIESGKSKFSGLDARLARRRLAALNVAQKLDDLSRLRSVGLHKLSGDRSGFWAISVNGPWRIVFRFIAGDAFEVEIVDYH